MASRHVQPIRMGSCMFGNLVQDISKRNEGHPLPLLRCETRIHDHPRNIERSFRAIGRYKMRAEPRLAPGTELLERHCVIRSAGDVLDSARGPLWVAQLREDR